MCLLLLLLLLLEEGSSGGPVPGMTGLGYSGGGNSGWGAGGAQWDRGANLKEYYAKRDEQEAQAVRYFLFISSHLKKYHIIWKK